MESRMNTPTDTPSRGHTRAIDAWVRGRIVSVKLDDGREIRFPVAHFPRLKDASDGLLSRVRIEARGTALRWEELDEDLSVDGILTGWHPPRGA